MVKRSRFGLPEPALPTLPVVALFNSVVLAVDGDPVVPWMIKATTPATCGDAIDVPLMVFVAELLDFHADVMLEPGAKMSTHEPKFEYDARASVDVVAPTAIALAARAGE